MTYNESQKQQLRDFIKEGAAKAAVYFKTTMGVPEDIFFEKWNEFKTTGEQLSLIISCMKKNPKAFEGMPIYKP